MEAQTTSRLIAPNRQRQNTTPLTVWPDITTNQPIVPEISIAAVICTVPLRISLCIAISILINDRILR
jgi:hypothetical protein